MMRTTPLLLVMMSAATARADSPAGIYSRLPVEAGPVAGAPDLVVRAAKDDTHCGGYAVSVVAVKKTTVLEPELVAAMTIDSPHGLDFTVDRDHSMKRTEAFMTDAQAKFAAARDVFAKRKTVVGLARSVQVMRRFAETIARVEIPNDVRTGDNAKDKADAFCAQIETVATPLADNADQAAAACRKVAASAGDGWWTQVCADRSAQRDAR